MAFAGMSVAQDVYTAGYYTNSSGKDVAAVYKNNTKLYEVGSNDVHRYSNDVVVRGNDVYWVMNNMGSDGNTYNWGDIYKNDVVYLNNPAGYGTHINALYNGNNLWAIGCKNIDGVQTAVAWKNNNSTPNYTMGSGSYNTVTAYAFRKNGKTYTTTGGLMRWRQVI